MTVTSLVALVYSGIAPKKDNSEILRAIAKKNQNKPHNFPLRFSTFRSLLERGLLATHLL